MIYLFAECIFKSAATSCSEGGDEIEKRSRETPGNPQEAATNGAAGAAAAVSCFPIEMHLTGGRETERKRARVAAASARSARPIPVGPVSDKGCPFLLSFAPPIGAVQLSATVRFAAGTQHVQQVQRERLHPAATKCDELESPGTQREGTDRGKKKWDGKGAGRGN